jgi:predicted RNA methylase
MSFNQLGLFGTDLDTPALGILTTATVPDTIDPEQPNFALAIETFAGRLQSGKLRESELVTIARDYGIDDIQDAYNALEGAVVSLVRENPTLAYAREIRDLMPAQRRRTERKEALQAFSTPPDMALLVQNLAAIAEDDVLLEPSAGTGMLVSAVNARIILNELDRNRRQILRVNFPNATIFNFDARYIDATLKGDRPTVVLMNPPFSADVDGSHGSGIGLTHIQSAIRLSVANARIIAIVGANQHPSNVDWEPVLAGKASIRLTVTVKGTDYYKMGTSFPTAIVVIDKAPGLPLELSSTDERSIDELAKIIPVLPRVTARHLRAIGGTRDAAKAGKAAARAFVPIFDGIRTLDYRYEPPTNQEDDGRFARYAPTLHFEDVTPHPSILVESKALGGVKLPPVDPSSVPVRLTDHAIKAAWNVQLESLIYIRRAFQRKLYITVTDDETGNNREQEIAGGILIGHGTGFGKGCTINAALLADMIDGNPLHLYFSENQDLYEDLIRDWSNIAGEQHAAAVHNLSNFSANDKLSMPAGIIYSTYSTMRMAERQTTRSRVQQLVESLGDNFSGIIVFDECHNLSNAIGKKGDRSNTGASQQGLAALAIQEAFPKAKIIYVSATCASSVEAYAYAERLGLWANNGPFESRQDFLHRMNTGGVGALELLTRDLKAQGLYLAAEISKAGINLQRITHKLSPEQIEAYNAVARGWREIWKNLDKIVREHDSKTSRAAKAAIAQTRQRSLQAMLGSLAAPSIIADMRDKLAKGFSVIGQFTNTMEAAQEKALANMEDGDDLESIDVSPKQLMLDYLDRVFPVAKTKIVVDEDGKDRTEILRDELNRIIEDPELVAVRDALKGEIAGAIVPDSMLTILLDEFGADHVAEITGRRRRLIRKIVDGRPTRVLENRAATAAIDETHDFMQGKKRILLFSEAKGGTGRSYHASLACENQQQRAHYLLQAGWRSDKAMQGFGRSHRAFQACDPWWIMCETNAPGQKRFTSTLARRLEILGAASRGQRDAASTGLFSAEDNLETEYGTRAVKDLLKSIAYSNKPLHYDAWLEQTNMPLLDGEGEVIDKTVAQFLNAVLSCDLGFNDDGPQEILMNTLVEAIDVLIDKAKKDGTYDFGLRTLRALSCSMRKNEKLSATDDGVTTYFTTIAAQYEAKKHTFAHTLQNVRKARQYHGTDAGYFIERNGDLAACYQTASSYRGGKEIRNYSLVFPDHIEYFDGYAPHGTKIADDTAADRWNLAIAAVNDTYERLHYFATGAILPIIRLLPTTLNAHIVNTDEGERILGIELQPYEVQTLFNALQLNSAITSDDVLEAVTKGQTAYYDSTIRVFKVRFGQEDRIEIQPPQHHVAGMIPTMRAAGINVEKIEYRWRFFVPVNDGTTAFTDAMKDRTLTSLT